MLDPGVGLTSFDPVFVKIGSGDTQFQINPTDPVIFGNLFVEVIAASTSPDDIAAFLTESFTADAEPPATGFKYIAAQGTANGLPVGPNNPAIFPGFEVDFLGNFAAGQHLVVGVPEPSSFVLLFFGMFAVLLVFAKLRNSSAAKTAA